MKVIFSLVSSLAILSGCAMKEYYQKDDLTQAGLNQDLASCQLYSMSIPQQQTEVTTYRSTTVRNGPYSTTTVGPDPYAQVGAALGDALANDVQQEKVRHLCMQTKGYTFVGWK